MSENDNPYWNAEDSKTHIDHYAHAVVESNYITAKWKNTPNAVDAANRAFCLYYYGRKSIEESGAYGDAYWEKRDSLERLAKKGSGGGVSDMQEALNHYWVNGGGWSDGNTINYYGGRGRCYNHTLIRMAEGPANFMKAIDKESPLIRQRLEHFQLVTRFITNIGLSNNSTTSELESASKMLSVMKTMMTWTDRLTWMMPAVVQTVAPATSSGYSALAKVEAFADGAARPIKTSMKLAEATSNIVDGLVVYEQARQAFNGDRKMGLALAALQFTASQLPVLGSFYGTIIAKLPGLVNNWTSFINDYTRRLDAPAAYLKARAERPRPFRCPICKSSGAFY